MKRIDNFIQEKLHLGKNTSMPISKDMTADEFVAYINDIIGEPLTFSNELYEATKSFWNFVKGNSSFNHIENEYMDDEIVYALNNIFDKSADKLVVYPLITNKNKTKFAILYYNINPTKEDSYDDLRCAIVNHDYNKANTIQYSDIEEIYYQKINPTK